MNSFSRSAAGTPGPLSAMTIRATALAASCCVSIDDSRRLAAGTRPRLHPAHGLDPVVHEVDDDPPNLLDVQPHGRQRRREGRGRCESG
jgi:hypothetical protein